MINIRYAAQVIISGTIEDLQIYNLPFKQYKMYYLLKSQTNQKANC